MHTKQLIKDALKNEPELVFAMLFGSRASGAERHDSDIDLGILTQSPLTPELHIALSEKVSEICGLPVDLVDIRKAGEPLLGEILKGEVLIGNNEQKAALLARHLVDQADFGPIRARILNERRERWIQK